MSFFSVTLIKQVLRGTSNSVLRLKTRCCHLLTPKPDHSETVFMCCMITNKVTHTVDQKQHFTDCRHGDIITLFLFNPLMGTLKPQSNGPLYSNTVIGTLVMDGWAVTFCTARRSLSGLRPRPCPSLLYRILQPTHQATYNDPWLTSHIELLTNVWLTWPVTQYTELFANILFNCVFTTNISGPSTSCDCRMTSSSWAATAALYSLPDWPTTAEKNVYKRLWL